MAENVGLTEEELAYEPEDFYAQEDVEIEREPVKWNEIAAKEYATKLAVANGIDDLKVRDDIALELMQRGTSPVADQLKANLEQEEKLLRTQVAAEQAETEGVDVIAPILQERLQEDAPDSLVDDAATDNYLNKRAPWWDEEEWNTILEKEEQIDNEFQREYAKGVQFEGSLAGNVAEFFGSMVPFVEQNSARRLGQMLEEEFGADFGSQWKAILAEGEYLNTVSEWMEELSSEEQLGVMEFIVENAPEVSGIFGHNDFIKLSLIESIVDRSRGDFIEGDVNVNRIINNAISLIDLIGVGAAVKTGINVATKSGKVVGGVPKSSTKAKMDRIDPEAGRAATAESAIDATGETAKKLGTTREDIIIEDLLARQEGFMDIPRWSSRAYERSLDLVGMLLKKDRNIQEHLTDVEKVRQAQKTEALLERVGGAKVWENGGTVKATDDGVEVRALYGKTTEEAYTFSEIGPALTKLQQRFPQAKTRVMARTYSGEGKAVEGKLDEAVNIQKSRENKAKLSEQKDKVVRLEQKKEALEEAIKAGKPSSKKGVELAKELKLTKTVLSSTKGQVTKLEREASKLDAQDYFIELSFKDDYRAGSNVLMHPDDVLVKGTKAKFLADISSGLSQHLSDSFFRAFDLSRGTERLMIELMKPLVKAKNKNKKVIVQLLDEGKTSEKTFKASEILERIPTDLKDKDIQEIMDGYYAVRQAADVSYELLNKMYRDKMLNEGLKHIEIGGMSTVGRLLNTVERSTITHVYDPVSKTTREIKASELAELERQGATVYRSEEIVGEGEGLTRNILVTDAGVVRELPEKVLNYRDGYLPRMYKEQYFITTKPRAMKLEGRALKESEIPTKTIMVAKSRKQAEALAKELQDVNPDSIVDWKHDRSLTSDQRRSSELDLEMNTNGLFFSKRGEHIKDVHNNLAEVEDPVSSIYRMVNAVSRKIEIEPVLDLMKRRWVNTFGDLTQHKYPASRGAIVNPTKIADERSEAAKAMWDYIDNMSSSTTATQNWRAMSVRFGEWLEDVTGSERIGSFFRTDFADRSPLSIARGSTFVSMIVLNPARQLFIQSQQALFLSGVDPKYVLSGSAYKDGMAMLLSHSDDTPDAVKELLRKSTGLSKGEWEEARAGFKESGLLEAIDSHLIGRDAILNVQKEITNSMAAAAAQNVKIGASGAINTVRQVGFDFGEMWNISTTYMLARKRWMKNNPGVDVASKEARFKIAADTRQLALGMTQAGSFGYQHGIFSLATQFLSVQQKALLAMTRGIPGTAGKFGNQALSVSEARRVALFQTMLYGASGTGMVALLDNVMEQAGVEELPQPVKHALYGGMYDLFVNGAISIATGDNVDLQFSNNIAAGSGMQDTLFRIIGEIGGEKDLLSLMAGPSATVGSRVGEVVGELRNILGAVQAGEPVGADNYRLAFDKLGSVASGYNNFVKGMAMKNHQRWVFSNMDKMPVEASDAEALVAGALGITGYKQGAYYDYLIDRKKKQELLRETATHYYNNITRKLAYLRDNQVPWADAQLMLAEDRVFIQNALDPHDADAVMTLVGEMINQRVDVGHGALADMLVQRAMGNRDGSSYDELIGGLARKGLISPDQHQDLIDLKNNLFGIEE